MSQNNVAKVGQILLAARWSIACLMLAACFVAQAQQDKSAPAKTSLTGRYEGSAKNKAEESITVSIDLTEKEGAFSGTIHSSHGDFPITGGSRREETATIEFDAGGPGTISAHIADDKLVGTWSAGEDGGSLEVKKVPAQEGGAKGKS
jgi:hypothetical protein